MRGDNPVLMTMELVLEVLGERRAVGRRQPDGLVFRFKFQTAKTVQLWVSHCTTELPHTKTGRDPAHAGYQVPPWLFGSIT